ncbi:MAG: hypothetical protein R2854_22645, partial [Caldilineaceae bacterium]
MDTDEHGLNYKNMNLNLIQTVMARITRRNLPDYPLLSLSVFICVHLWLSFLVCARQTIPCRRFPFG